MITIYGWSTNRRRKGSTGGRPVSYDVEDDKQPNVIERFFNRVKHGRGIASRYDRGAITYRIVLVAVVDRLT